MPESPFLCSPLSLIESPDIQRRLILPTVKYSFGHYLQLVAIDDSRNMDQPINWELCRHALHHFLMKDTRRYWFSYLAHSVFLSKLEVLSQSYTHHYKDLSRVNVHLVLTSQIWGIGNGKFHITGFLACCRPLNVFRLLTRKIDIWSHLVCRQEMAGS